MYTNIKNIQILISALKVYNIQHVVLSPGGSDIPIVHSIENDNWFIHYSVVDERSAVYFALGLAQELNRPVACVCTSGTAVSNYLPGITEAFYQDIPLIAITADKNPHFQGQIQTQKINQVGIFGECVRSSVELPLCKDEEEIWYCERVIKEAFMACFQKTHGPVQINVPVVSSYNIYNQKNLPTVRKVNYINCETSQEEWNKYYNILLQSKRILVFIGQDITFNQKDITDLEKFFMRYNVVYAIEHHSNIRCKGCINTYPITETRIPKDENLVPDLVISIGNNVVSYGMKPFLRRNREKFQHIEIDSNGRFRDVFMRLTDLFECTPQTFFHYFANYPGKQEKGNNMEYYNTWKNKAECISLPPLNFTELCVGKYLCDAIPENSILHTAILNSSRIIQYFPLATGVKTFSNTGALGIDGCLSTFMGHAAATDKLCFLLIGDLAFFYDMNAAGLRSLKNNVRIVLMNNGGGSEFHLFLDKKDVPTMNENICAQHHKTAKGWIESLGYEYFAVHNLKDLDTAFENFSSTSDKPKFIEVFSNLETDAKFIKDFYSSFAPKDNIIEYTKKVVKKVINKL